ncbi:MAG: patatin-like phospholipase family protein [Pseudonocardia sp.]|nr:patatin-like phospholipase family protein [Pseudonocardia sp.]
MTRTGLVLGAGGLLGSAWMTAALVALQDTIDRPLGELDLIVGTSAGSVLGSALRCGQSVDELLAHQQGMDPDELAPDLEDVVDLPDIRRIERETGNGLPPLPWPVMGSPCLLASAALRPHRLNPVVVASSLLPLGRARLSSLVDMVAAMQTRVGITADGWIPGSPLWLVAVDYDSGRRTVFGRAGGPPATVGEAVLASCSIPGWFAPQVIGGRRYVDGGVASTTSLDLLARPGAPELDEVIVLAPMASHAYDCPSDPLAQLERKLRRLLTRWLDAEVAAVRAAGVRVTVLTPGPPDLAAMGGNLMNPRRRERVLDTALASSRGALAAAFALSDDGLQEGAA